MTEPVRASVHSKVKVHSIKPNASLAVCLPFFPCAPVKQTLRNYAANFFYVKFFFNNLASRCDFGGGLVQRLHYERRKAYVLHSTTNVYWRLELQAYCYMCQPIRVCKLTSSGVCL
jgi:hypothetical protein